MKIHLAGGTTRSVLLHAAIKGANRLYSAMYERQLILQYPNMVGKLTVPNPEASGTLIVDSGAYSWNKVAIYQRNNTAEAKLPPARKYAEGYLEMMYNNRHKPFVWVEFDVYMTLPEDYINSMYKEWQKWPGKHKDAKFMRVYHPELDGGTIKKAKEWVADGMDYIGIAASDEQTARKLFQFTRDKIKVHGFGITIDEIMKLYPFFSTDSTSWISGGQYGSFVVFDQAKGKLGREYMVRHLVKDKDKFARAHLKSASSRSEILMTSIDAYVEYEKYITKLWETRGIVWQN